MALNRYLSIITLNANCLNASIKRHRAAEWMRKQDPYVLSPRDPPENEIHTQTKSKEVEKDISCK